MKSLKNLSADRGAHRTRIECGAMAVLAVLFICYGCTTEAPGAQAELDSASADPDLHLPTIADGGSDRCMGETCNRQDASITVDSGGESCIPAGYVLTFQDEFDDSSVSFPNDTWATTYVNWGRLRTLELNGEEEYYVDASLGIDPFSLSDGILTISGDRTAPSDSANVEGYPYTSGLITTEGYSNYPPGWPQAAFAQRFGYFDMRARLPRGQGLWPAFWLVGLSPSTHYEIDIFEVLGHEPDRVYQTTHLPQGGEGKETDLVDTSDGFHSYSLLWTATDLIWFIDCVETNRQAVGDAIPVPMYVIANLAIGGSWPGSPDDATLFPATMDIDYVRVYQAE